MVEGRRRWVDRMREEGKRLPGGAKPGITPPRVKARREAKAMQQEAERWAAMTPEQRLGEARERERAAALERLDAIREHFRRGREIAMGDTIRLRPACVAGPSFETDGIVRYAAPKLNEFVGLRDQDAALFIKGPGWQADDADRKGRQMVDRRQGTVPEGNAAPDAGAASAPRQPVTRAPAQLERNKKDVLDSSARLDDLTTLSLDKLHEILTLPLPREVLTSLEHKDFASALALAKTQLAATERVLATQVRVDETRLKRRQVDVLPRLLQIIAEEKRLIAEAKTVDASPVEGREADVRDE
jgi:hypothetical protein